MSLSVHQEVEVQVGMQETEVKDIIIIVHRLPQPHQKQMHTGEEEEAVQVEVEVLEI
jgi:hypothetical protein